MPRLSALGAPRADSASSIAGHVAHHDERQDGGAAGELTAWASRQERSSELDPGMTRMYSSSSADAGAREQVTAAARAAAPSPLPLTTVPRVKEARRLAPGRTRMPSGDGPSEPEGGRGCYGGSESVLCCRAVDHGASRLRSRWPKGERRTLSLSLSLSPSLLPSVSHSPSPSPTSSFSPSLHLRPCPPPSPPHPLTHTPFVRAPTPARSLNHTALHPLCDCRFWGAPFEPIPRLPDHECPPADPNAPAELRPDSVRVRLRLRSAPAHMSTAAFRPLGSPVPSLSLPSRQVRAAAAWTPARAAIRVVPFWAAARGATRRGACCWCDRTGRSATGSPSGPPSESSESRRKPR